MVGKSTRREFLAATAGGVLGTGAATAMSKPPIQGFEQGEHIKRAVGDEWVPKSSRKIRMGIVGYGVCRFGAQFSFQDHPNVEVIAVSDLVTERRAALAKACRCTRTYPSLEDLVKDDQIEAVFVATDAPSHCRHCLEVLRHGKHVATAVPAIWEHVEDAERLLDAVRTSGLNYMMMETSCYRPDLYAMRQIYRVGGFGKIVYAEGEYYHFACSTIDSYHGWRNGLPPQWYPTHSNAYFIGVTGGHFREVSCMGMESNRAELQPKANRYGNGFGTEVALFRTSEGGMARMAVSWDSRGMGGEVGRVRGQKGTMAGLKYDGEMRSLPSISRPALPPGVKPGGHGGSHGYLADEFISSILESRPPLIDIGWALNMTVPGIVAHRSAQRNGLLMPVPHFRL